MSLSVNSQSNILNFPTELLDRIYSYCGFSQPAFSKTCRLFWHISRVSFAYRHQLSLLKQKYHLIGDLDSLHNPRRIYADCFRIFQLSIRSKNEKIQARIDQAIETWNVEDLKGAVEAFLVENQGDLPRLDRFFAIVDQELGEVLSLKDILLPEGRLDCLGKLKKSVIEHLLNQEFSIKVSSENIYDAIRGGDKDVVEHLITLYNTQNECHFRFIYQTLAIAYKSRNLELARFIRDQFEQQRQTDIEGETSEFAQNLMQLSNALTRMGERKQWRKRTMHGVYSSGDIDLIKHYRDFQEQEFGQTDTFDRQSEETIDAFFSVCEAGSIEVIEYFRENNMGIYPCIGSFSHRSFRRYRSL